MINSHALYRLSYGGICLHLFRCILSGDSCGNRTSASLLMARITDAHRFELKTVHRTVFLTLKPSRVRFRKLVILIYFHLFRCLRHFGDSCGNRTRVAGVRGRSLNRLTNEPFLLTKDSFEPLVSLGAPSGARTRDTLIKSQVLYQLS